MKTLPIFIVALLFGAGSMAQSSADSLGFTNKAEAKNLLVNGKKEGKWCVYVKVWTDGEGDVQQVCEKITKRKRKANYYRLAIYKDGIPQGMMRDYYMDGKLEGEVMFVNGKQRGSSKGYYPSGKLAFEYPFTSTKPDRFYKAYYESGILKEERSCRWDKMNGVRNIYDKKGELMLADTITNGIEKGVVRLYDTTGRVNIEMLFTKDTVKGGTINMPLIKASIYRERTTAMKEFYKDGKLKSETIYNGGFDNGVTTRYDESGNVVK